MYESIWNKEKNEASKNCDIELRCSIFKTLGIFKAALESLEREKEECISDAREAKDVGDEIAYQSAKKKLRLYLLNIKMFSEMMVDLEMSIELDNMYKMIDSYNSCIDNLKKRRSLNFGFQGDGKRLKEKRREFGDLINQYTGIYKGFSEQSGGECGEDIITDEELDEVVFKSKENLQDISDVINARLKLIKSKIKED